MFQFYNHSEPNSPLWGFIYRVCVCVHEHVNMHACVCACMHICMWGGITGEPKVSILRIFLPRCVFYFEAGSLIVLELTDSVRSAPEIDLSLPLQPWITWMHHDSQLCFYRWHSKHFANWGGSSVLFVGYFKVSLSCASCVLVTSLLVVIKVSPDIARIPWRTVLPPIEDHYLHRTHLESFSSCW